MQRWRRPRRVVLTVALTVGWVGCAEPGAKHWPARVEVEQVVDRSTQDHELTPDAVRRVLSTQLDRSPLFATGPGDGAPRRAEAWFSVARDRQGARVLNLTVHMQPPVQLQRTLHKGLEAKVAVVPASGSLDPETDLRFAVERAVAVLEARVLLAEGRPEGVQQVLRTEDAEILRMGLEWVRDNEMRSAATRVAALLDHPDERVSWAAVEAIGIVGDRADVPRMLQAVRLGDRGHTHRLYEALGRLGGVHAQAFLEFAARNEDDPSLAVAAAHALDRVRSGDSEPEVASDAPNGRIPRGHR